MKPSDQKSLVAFSPFLLAFKRFTIW